MLIVVNAEDVRDGEPRRWFADEAAACRGKAIWSDGDALHLEYNHHGARAALVDRLARPVGIESGIVKWCSETADAAQAWKKRWQALMAPKKRKAPSFPPPPADAPVFTPFSKLTLSPGDVIEAENGQRYVGFGPRVPRSPATNADRQAALLTGRRLSLWT